MLINIAAIVLGYLIGAIPSAYIYTRFVTGKDIRQLGSGNVGALNTYRQVGDKGGIIVFLADMGKGMAVVAIARWLLGVSELILLLVVLAAVVGHNWSVFLKFGGGRGMATSIGAISVYLFLYGYLIALVIFLGVLVISLLATRKNYALAVIIALITVPVSASVLVGSWQFVLVSTVILILVLIKVMPIARNAWVKSGNIGDFIRGNR